MIIKELVRKKSFKFYYIIMILIFTIILSLLLFYNTVSNKILEKSEYYINRELLLIVEDKMENFSLPDSIVGIYPYNDIEIDFNNLEYVVKPYFEHNNISLEKGRKIQNKKEIIAPSNFIINEKVTINEEIYTVVGIYQEMIINDTLYISLDDWNEYEVDETKYVLIVDFFDNVENTIEELASKQYYTNVFNSRFLKELSLLENLKVISFLIVIVLFTFIALLFYGILKSILEEEKYNIAIFKSVGYKIKQLFLIYWLKQLFLISFAYVTSICIVYGTIFTLNFVIKTGLILPFKYFIGTFLILIFINFISAISNIKKIEKIHPTIILQNI